MVSLTLSLQHSSIKRFQVLYRLDLMLDSHNNPKMLQIYHRDIQYKRRKGRKNSKARRSYLRDGIKTRVYDFSCSGNILTEVAIYMGDFTSPSFRWSERLIEEFKGVDIYERHQQRAFAAARKIDKFLKSQKSKSSTIKEKDHYDLFISPLEKIIDASE
jgi:hypothetical protein